MGLDRMGWDGMKRQPVGGCDDRGKMGRAISATLHEQLKPLLLP